MCVARAANINSSSQVIGIGSSVGVSSNSRMRSARGVPPGSRVTMTSSPRATSESRNAAICVVLPTPSLPSMVMNLPAIHRATQLPQVPPHGEVVLSERLGEVVTAVARPCRHEE